MALSVSGFMRIVPVACANLTEAGFSVTSTMRKFPAESTWERPSPRNSGGAFVSSPIAPGAFDRSQNSWSERLMEVIDQSRTQELGAHVSLRFELRTLQQRHRGRRP